jgi:hypothetical protein
MRLEEIDQSQSSISAEKVQRKSNTQKMFDTPWSNAQPFLAAGTASQNVEIDRHPSPKQRRSLSDCGLSVAVSPKIQNSVRRSQDDSSIIIDSPTTSQRLDFFSRDSGLQLARDAATEAVVESPNPLSPRLDRSNSYGSPASLLPRRSRGLDFSRAATNLHHSILAEQSSADSSPVSGFRHINAQQRKLGLSNYGDLPGGNAAFAWPAAMSGEKTGHSNSFGSASMMDTNWTSSSSDNDDPMDADDIDDSIITTPQLPQTGTFAPLQPNMNQWAAGQTQTPSSLMNFQRARSRHARNGRTPGSSIRRSPKPGLPSVARSLDGVPLRDPDGEKSRRESGWSSLSETCGNDSDEASSKVACDAVDAASAATANKDGQRGVVKRVVTRRGNMLVRMDSSTSPDTNTQQPKTKGFARIRAALAEESTPIETEVRREANVIRQVRDSDADLEPTRSIPHEALSSPMLGPTEVVIEDVADEESMDGSTSFSQQVMKNSKGKNFWETFPGDVRPCVAWLGWREG